MPEFLTADFDESESSMTGKDERTKTTEDEEYFVMLRALGESVGRNEKVNHETYLQSQIEEYLSVVSNIGKRASEAGESPTEFPSSYVF
jgi:hypothetical protein